MNVQMSRRTGWVSNYFVLSWIQSMTVAESSSTMILSIHSSYSVQVMPIHVALSSTFKMEGSKSLEPLTANKLLPGFWMTHPALQNIASILVITRVSRKLRLVMQNCIANYVIVFLETTLIGVLKIKLLIRLPILLNRLLCIRYKRLQKIILTFFYQKP